MANAANVGNGADVANPANVANAVFGSVAVPPRRDAAVVLWRALFATNGLALGASGKGGLGSDGACATSLTCYRETIN